MSSLRHTLVAWPRLVLGLLLAFAIEILQPSVHPAWHSHVGGDRPHTHVGLASNPTDVSARGVAFGTDGVRRDEQVSRQHPSATIRPVGAGGLHAHFPQPIHLAHAAVASTAVARGHVTAWSAALPETPHRELHGCTQPRAPPSLLV